MFHIALAEFQDHGLQSVAGHPQHGPGQSRSGPWRGQLRRQWGVRGRRDPRPAAAASTEKSVLYSDGVNSGGGSRKGSSGFWRPVSSIRNKAEFVWATHDIPMITCCFSDLLLPAWAVYHVVTPKERDWSSTLASLTFSNLIGRCLRASSENIIFSCAGFKPTWLICKIQKVNCVLFCFLS